MGSESTARDAAGLDVPAVSGWIADLGVGAVPPLRFERIGAGYSNLTFLVTDAEGRSWVLRRPPLGELLASAHDVAREHRILASLESTPVPAPRVFALTEDRAVTPAPLLLMEYVPGLVISSLADAERLSPETRAAIGRALPAALAKVHAVDLAATGLDSLTGSRTPHAERLLKRWRGQWERSRTRDLPLVDDLAERLEAAIPETREKRLIHGDFHLLNMILAPSGEEVAAIVDWELCTLGDPLADLGGMLAYWPDPGEPSGRVIGFSSLPGFPTGAEIAATYAERSGRSIEELGFWRVLGIWKLGIIVEGVLRRAQNDRRNENAAGAPHTWQIDQLFERADRIAAPAGI